VFFGIYIPEHVETVKPIGTVFLRLIKMVIVPLLFFSLVSGITGMRDPGSIGRVAKKSVIAYLGTTCLAVTLCCFAIGVAFILEPGCFARVLWVPWQRTKILKKMVLIFCNFLLKLFPIIFFICAQAFADSNILQVVFFSIFTGIIILVSEATASLLRWKQGSRAHKWNGFRC